MAAFLFFLLAANNVIKIVRDSLFPQPLSHNSAGLCLSIGCASGERRHWHLFSLYFEAVAFTGHPWFSRLYRR